MPKRIKKTCTDINLPEAILTMTGSEYAWKEYGVKFIASSVRNDLSCELKVELDHRPVFKCIFHHRINLLSVSAIRDMIRFLEHYGGEQGGQLPWQEMVVVVQQEIINNYRKGEGIVDLSKEAKDETITRMLIEPMIVRNEFNIIFGDGGVGKSTIAVFLAGIVSSDSMIGAELPYEANGFTVYDTHSVLYLDWETSRKSITDIVKGCMPDAHIYYKHCVAPLSDIIESVLQEAEKVGCKTVVIDSIGMASGGDLNLSEVALRFGAAVRRLTVNGITVIGIAHNAKNLNGDRTVYGSVFFTNMARNVWECKKESENAYSDNITCYHRKTNIMKLQPPFPITISRNGYDIYVSGARL